MNTPHPNNPVKQSVFNFIVQFKQRHDGNSPSMREIMAGCNIRSTSVVNYYLELLVKDGMIVCSEDAQRSRMISVVGGTWLAPAPSPFFSKNEETLTDFKQAGTHNNVSY
jgi:SOS-response transcriptional repressor LexA